MNAEESRKKAHERDHYEIKEISGLIEQAANSGQTRINLDRGLRDGTLQWLKDNGYKWQTTHYIDDNFSSQIIVSKGYISWH